MPGFKESSHARLGPYPSDRIDSRGGENPRHWKGYGVPVGQKWRDSRPQVWDGTRSGVSNYAQ